MMSTSPPSAGNEAPSPPPRRTRSRVSNGGAYNNGADTTARSKSIDRTLNVLLVPICLAAFFAARSFGQQLRASQRIQYLNDIHDEWTSQLPHDDLPSSRREATPQSDLLSKFQQRQSRRTFTDYSTFPSTTSLPYPPTPVPIFLLPQKPPNPQSAGELKHFIVDAIKRSNHLTSCHDPLNTDAIWVVDPVRYKWHHAFALVRDTTIQRLNIIRTQMRKQNVDNATISNLTLRDVPAWEFIIVDYMDDSFAYAHQLAMGVSEAMGRPNSTIVKFATRKHVRHRNLGMPQNDEQPFGPLGEPTNWTEHKTYGLIQGMPKVVRYGIRTDLVNYLEITQDGVFYEKEAMETNQTLLDLPSLERTTDVFHPWMPGNRTRLAEHRNGVSLLLRRLEQERPDLHMVLVPMGARSRPGRNAVQKAYVDTLLSSKIVVTSQRDRWEDHYRLMEALATGGLVLTDPMTHLPSHLVDGESLVVYHSLAELRDKVLYYLENESERLDIAKRGHYVALNYHRSWHDFESLIFGNPDET